MQAEACRQATEAGRQRRSEAVWQTQAVRGRQADVEARMQKQAETEAGRGRFR